MTQSNPDVLNLPLRENEDSYKHSLHSNRINSYIKRNNKKRLREERDANKDNNNAFSNVINLSLPIKKKAKNKSIEHMIERITLNDKEEHFRARTVKIFSDGIMPASSYLLKNLYKNYYPCIIPEHYSSQVRDSIVTNQINKIVTNMNKDRRQVMDKRRTTLPIGNKGWMNDINCYSTSNKWTVKKMDLNNKWLELKDNNIYDYEYDNDDDDDDDNNVEDDDYDDDEDSNAENNPNKSYPDTENSNSDNEKQNYEYEEEIQEENDCDDFEGVNEKAYTAYDDQDY